MGEIEYKKKYNNNQSVMHTYLPYIFRATNKLRKILEKKNIKIQFNAAKKI